jgi:hypothetical protein
VIYTTPKATTDVEKELEGGSCVLNPRRSAQLSAEIWFVLSRFRLQRNELPDDISIQHDARYDRTSARRSTWNCKSVRVTLKRCTQSSYKPLGAC